MAGALLGVLMMLLVVPFAWWRESALVGLSVGMSLLAITTLAATAGAAFPLLFDRMGLDQLCPALHHHVHRCGWHLVYLKTAGWLLVHLPQLVQATGFYPFLCFRRFLKVCLRFLEYSSHNSKKRPMAPAATTARPKTAARAPKSVTADVDLVRSYLRDIGRVPLLTHEQEITLGRRFRS